MEQEVEIMQAGVVNKNGRLYSSAVCIAMVEEGKEKIEQGRLVGTLGLGSREGSWNPGAIPLTEVSHSVTSMRWDEEQQRVYATIQPLKTPQGIALEQCLEETLARGPAFRPTGLCSTKQVTLDDGRVIDEVYDYSLVSVDLVFNPA